MTTDLRFQGGDLARQLFKKMHRRGIDDGVNGVKTQSIEVIIPQPHQSVVTEKSPYFGTAGPIEIDGRAPRRCVTVGKIRSKIGQMVTGRSQMIVDDVENHSQPMVMASVNELL
jgi:hypothetical protein